MVSVVLMVSSGELVLVTVVLVLQMVRVAVWSPGWFVQGDLFCAVPEIYKADSHLAVSASAMRSALRVYSSPGLSHSSAVVTSVTGADTRATGGAFRGHE